MELRIQRDRPMQIFLGLFVVAETLIYHAGVKQEERVFRIQVERFLHRIGGLLAAELFL